MRRAVGQVDAAHAGLGGELDEPRSRRGPRRRAAACWPGQVEDALALGRLVGHRRQRRPAAPPRGAATPPSGTNCVARRLPIVIVPVLSSSSVSMSPATSTALPLLAMMLAMQRPVHARDADGRQQGADGRRDQAHQQGDQVGMSERQVEVAGHRVERGGDDQEDEREGGQDDRQGDLVGRLLADRPFDQGDHAVEEALAGLGGDLDDDPVGEHAGAAGDARAVAAGLADHRALSPVIADSSTEATPSTTSPSAGITCPASTTTRSPVRSSVEETTSPVPRPEARRAGRPACPGGSPGGCRPGPCRGPRPAPRRSWRTAP